MFGNGAGDRVLNALVAENADLRDTLRREREAWNAERQQLLNKILAVTHPQAVALLQPQPPIRPRASSAVSPQVARRINFPGYTRRPPTPPYPQRAAEKVSDNVDLVAEKE